MTCVAFASILSFLAKYRFMDTFMMFIRATSSRLKRPLTLVVHTNAHW